MAEKKNKSAKRRNRRRAAKNGTKVDPQTKGLPIQTFKTVRGVRGRGIREQGTDLIVSKTVSKTDHGVVMQFVVSPDGFPRLGQLARSFQRIRYHRLRFEIVAGWPSTIAGSYVSGFVKDATDPVSKETASVLLASGGTASKIWQSTDVNVSGFPDLYYTSISPVDQRWASPGSFVIAILGTLGAAGQFDVYCHWDVSLTEPTYETEEGGDETGFATCNVDAYASSNNKYLSKRKGASWEPLKNTDFTPTLLKHAKVNLLSFRVCSTQNSAGSFSGVYAFRTVKCGEGDHIFPVDETGAESTLNFEDEVYVLARGEKGELINPPNAKLASWFLSPLHRHRNLYAGSGPIGRRSPGGLPSSQMASSAPIATSSSPHTSDEMDSDPTFRIYESVLTALQRLQVPSATSPAPEAGSP